MVPRVLNAILMPVLGGLVPAAARIAVPNVVTEGAAGIDPEPLPSLTQETPLSHDNKQGFAGAENMCQTVAQNDRGA